MYSSCCAGSCNDTALGITEPCDAGPTCVQPSGVVFECLCEAGQMCSGSVCSSLSLLELENGTQTCIGKQHLDS